MHISDDGIRFIKCSLSNFIFSEYILIKDSTWLHVCENLCRGMYTYCCFKVKDDETNYISNTENPWADECDFFKLRNMKLQLWTTTSKRHWAGTQGPPRAGGTWATENNFLKFMLCLKREVLDVSILSVEVYTKNTYLVLYLLGKVHG